MNRLPGPKAHRGAAWSTLSQRKRNRQGSGCSRLGVLVKEVCIDHGQWEGLAEKSPKKRFVELSVRGAGLRQAE